MSLMTRVKSRLRQRLRFEPLWLDTDAAPARIAALPEAWMRAAAAELRADGLAVLRGHHAPAACVALAAAFKDYAARSPDAAPYRDAHGLHERLANFHLVSRHAQAFAEDDRIVRFLELLFEAEPAVVGSLYFEKGSTQSIHRDTPCFFTNPLNHFFGVWTALEDVTADAGPLTYFKGGHTLVPDRGLLDAETRSEDYFPAIVAACRAAGLVQTELLARQGDVVIWHPQLPHGGAPRRDETRSRASIVFHYKPVDAVIMGPTEFFSGSRTTPRHPQQPVVQLGRLTAIDHGGPQFFHNRYEGNFDEF